MHVQRIPCNVWKQSEGRAVSVCSIYRRALKKFQKIKELLDKCTIGQSQMFEILQYYQSAPEDLVKCMRSITWLILRRHHCDDRNRWESDWVLRSGGTVSVSCHFTYGVFELAARCYVADFCLDQVMILGTEGTLLDWWSPKDLERSGWQAKNSYS